MPELINLNEIKQAQSNTHRLIRKTPLVPFANSIEENTPDLLYLKLENQNPGGSIKDPLRIPGALQGLPKGPGEVHGYTHTHNQTGVIGI